MDKDRVKKIAEQVDQLDKALKEAVADGAQKTKELEKLQSDLRVARELLAIAQRDPIQVERLCKALEELNSKNFPLLENELKLKGQDELFAAIKSFLANKDGLKIANLDEIVMPETMKVLGLKKGIESITMSVKGLVAGIKNLATNVFKADVTGTVRISNKEPADAIPVRLVEKAGNFFYDALVSVLGSGGSAASDTILSQILAAINAQSTSPPTSTGDGTTTVTTAGTRVQLASNSCKRVIIQAHEDNTDAVVVGGATVVGAKSGRRGTALFATQSQSFNVSNTNLLYVDSVVSGEKVHWYFEA